MYPLFSILSLFIVDTFLLILAFILAYHIWIKEQGVEIPIDREAPVKNVRKHFQRRALTFSSRSWEHILDKYFNLLWDLTPGYWIKQCDLLLNYCPLSMSQIKYCGIDAYIYLFYQRTIFKLLSIFCALSLCLSIPINVFLSTDENWSLENMFVRTTLNNKTMTEFTSWLHVLMLVGFSLFCFRVIFQMKDEIREEYIRQFTETSSKYNTQWLKARTVHVFGIPQQDRKGIMLANYLNDILKPINGRVQGIVVQPDFEKLFRLEVRKKEMELLSNFLQSRPMGCCFRCLLPGYLKNPIQLAEAKNNIDNEIQRETEIPFMGSGHAFVCFDSGISMQCYFRKGIDVEVMSKQAPECFVRSFYFSLLIIFLFFWFFPTDPKRVPNFSHHICMQYCLKEFQRIGLLDALHMSCIACRERCLACIGRPRPRMTSTFGKYIEMDFEAEQVVNPSSDMRIIMERASEPLDINWFNIADDGSRGYYVCRRIFLNLLAILVLLFLSTPTAMVSVVERALSKQEVVREWVSLLPFITIWQDFISPLFIMALNHFLLLLIGYSATFERHSTYSAYQYSVFGKFVLYLLLNMLIIPALTLATAQSLYSVIVEKNYDIAQILNDMYISDSGTFFVVLMIQCACYSAMGGMIRLSEIFSNYCSSWLAHFQRKFLNDSEPWRRKENFIFSYGYQYAYMIVIFTIVIIFSTTVPLVTIAGSLFFGIMHVVDGYRILTIHMKEMESTGGLPSRVLNVTLLSVFLYQVGMLSYFYMHQYYYQAIVITLVFIITICANIAKMEVLFDPSQINIEKMAHNPTILSKYLDRWRSEYSHPLYVKRMASLTEELEEELRFAEYQRKAEEEKSGEQPILSDNQMHVPLNPK